MSIATLAHGRFVASLLALTIMAAPLAGCRSSSSAPGEAPSAVAEGPQKAPQNTPAKDAPPAGDDDPSGGDRGEADYAKHPGKRGKGKRRGSKRMQSLRKILIESGVSKEQVRTIMKKLREQRGNKGAKGARAEEVLAEVLPSLPAAQKDAAVKLVSEEMAAPDHEAEE